MKNKYFNIIFSIILLCSVIIVTLKYCGHKKTYTQADIDAINLSDSIKKQEYIDSLDFVRGQLDLQFIKDSVQTDRVIGLEKFIDSLTAKHEITKQGIKDYPSDTGYYVLAPNEYVSECDTCFNTLKVYKKENSQLRFESDAYSSLLRAGSEIQANRINELDSERLRINKLLNDCRIARAYAPTCDTTRKVKLSLMGMFSNPFLPKGGGFGAIYEDKKFNEYGAHVIFTGKGNVYLFNIAKTISFRRKK